MREIEVSFNVVLSGFTKTSQSFSAPAQMVMSHDVAALQLPAGPWVTSQRVCDEGVLCNLKRIKYFMHVTYDNMSMLA